MELISSIGADLQLATHTVLSMLVRYRLIGDSGIRRICVCIIMSVTGSGPSIRLFPAVPHYIVV